eukprot:212554_1
MGICNSIASDHSDERNTPSKAASTHAEEQHQLTTESDPVANNDADNHNLPDNANADALMNVSNVTDDANDNKVDTVHAVITDDHENDKASFTMPDAWKLRKFHSTMYDTRLVALMDANDNDFLVIDVRDPSLDYPGGHIKTSVNIFHEEFIKQLPVLIEKYNHKTNIIMHCMYSQSRGPGCCRWYCLGIECLLRNYHKNKNEQEFAQCIEQDEDFEVLKSITLDDTTYQNLINQSVLVLKGGFRAWVNKYKDNDKYVEDFEMQHWNYETVGGKRELYHKNDW